MKNIEELIQQYYLWLKSRTGLFTHTETGWTQISTTFIGLFNDSIEIFAKVNNEEIILSDDGLTLHNLELAGASIIRSPKRKELLEKILLNYGVNLINNVELQVIAKEENFSQKKHNLISAIIEISDMFMLAKPTITSIFKEDVQSYLDEQEIIYTPQFIARGFTGIEFIFDFHIAYKQKEIVLKSFNNLNILTLTHFLFAWQDIQETRRKITNKPIDGLAIINNEEKAIKLELLEAIHKKKADYILWTERHQSKNIKKLLAA